MGRRWKVDENVCNCLDEACGYVSEGSRREVVERIELFDWCEEFRTCVSSDVAVLPQSTFQRGWSGCTRNERDCEISVT